MSFQFSGCQLFLVWWYDARPKSTLCTLKNNSVFIWQIMIFCYSSFLSIFSTSQDSLPYFHFFYLYIPSHILPWNLTILLFPPIFSKNISLVSLYAMFFLSRREYWCSRQMRHYMLVSVALLNLSIPSLHKARVNSQKVRTDYVYWTPIPLPLAATRISIPICALRRKWHKRRKWAHVSI